MTQLAFKNQPQTQPTIVNRVIESDYQSHIDDEKVNAIRDGKLVQVYWHELTDAEKRSAHCSLFSLSSYINY